MQNLLGYGGEKYVKEGVIRHYVGQARLSWMDIEDVAAVAAASLLDPEASSWIGASVPASAAWKILNRSRSRHTSNNTRARRHY